MAQALASDLPERLQGSDSDKPTPLKGVDDGEHHPITPDAEFSRALLNDPAGAAHALCALARRDNTPRNIHVKQSLASKFCSIMQVVLKRPAADRPKLLQYPFVDAVMEVITDEESYSTLYDRCSRSDNGLTVWVDDKSVDMLYTALLVSTLLIDLVGQSAHDGLGALTDVKSGSLLKTTLLCKARVIWKILWDKSLMLFDPTRGFGELKLFTHAHPPTIQAAMADCLIALDKLLYPMQYKHLEKVPDWDVIMRAQLVCWLYHSHIKDRSRSEALFNRFYDHLFTVYIFDVFSARVWIERVFVNDHLRAGLRNALRSDLRSRHASSDHHFIFLSLFTMLAKNPVFDDATKGEVGVIDGPVFWFMKTLQREVCMRYAPDAEPTVAALALDHLARWCAMRDLSIIEVVHSETGANLIPYMGYIILADFCDQPTAYTRTVRHIVEHTERWLKSNRVRLATIRSKAPYYNQEGGAPKIPESARQAPEFRSSPTVTRRKHLLLWALV